MNEDIQDNSEKNGGPEVKPGPQIDQKSIFARWSEALLQMGLGESMVRVGSSVLTLFAIAIVIWLVQMFFKQVPEGQFAVAAAPAPTATLAVSMQEAPAVDEPELDGIPRLALPYTTIPSRPRQEISSYIVQEGDTLFGISEKYGLDPETILWGNYSILLDDPHALKPGQQLSILPVDGTLYEWQDGDGLNGVASFFGVAPEEILNFPGNNLDPATIGDYVRPNIEPGSILIIPGGRREFVSWSAPLGITREDPALARSITHLGRITWALTWRVQKVKVPTQPMQAWLCMQAGTIMDMEIWSWSTTETVGSRCTLT